MTTSSYLFVKQEAHLNWADHLRFLAPNRDFLKVQKLGANPRFAYVKVYEFYAQNNKNNQKGCSGFLGNTVGQPKLQSEKQVKTAGVKISKGRGRTGRSLGGFWAKDSSSRQAKTTPSQGIKGPEFGHSASSESTAVSEFCFCSLKLPATYLPQCTTFSYPQTSLSTCNT
jgi:hypothetical protein